MTIQISGVHVLADDIDAAVAFYGDVLGFTVRNTVENGGFRWVTLVSDEHADLDATFDRISASPDAEVVQEPTDQFWGVRDAAVRDPAGNMVRIAQA